jgi:hypothetical protein
VEWYGSSAPTERTASRGGNCRLPIPVNNASGTLCQQAEREALLRWRAEAPCRRDRPSVDSANSLAAFPSVEPAEHGLLDKRPKSLNDRG